MTTQNGSVKKTTVHSVIVGFLILKFWSKYSRRWGYFSENLRRFLKTVLIGTVIKTNATDVGDSVERCGCGVALAERRRQNHLEPTPADSRAGHLNYYGRISQVCRTSCYSNGGEMAHNNPAEMSIHRIRQITSMCTAVDKWTSSITNNLLSYLFVLISFVWGLLLGGS